MLLYALCTGKVDYILQDALSAQYWARQIPIFTTFGKPFVYGYGFGIAINNKDLGLLEQINKALIQFENSGDFKKTYDRYVP